MLSISESQRNAIVATCVRAMPDEGCGVLLGTTDGVVAEVVPATNVAASARVYELNPHDMLRSSRRADELGCDVIGVFHSHTHSDAYPSPTDQQQAPDPEWHYVIVSLRLVPTVLRSYRLTSDSVTEEPVTVST